MAANDLDSENVKKQELNDITTCCICSEVYTDPKALPCIHTFCLKCIQATGVKTNKGLGDEMPCPICRRLFRIPPEGFHGLPKNFFIERLIEVENLSNQRESSMPLCDACVEENEEEGKEISVADSYCVDCNQKFCQECCKHHRKLKLTKHHRLVPLTEHESGQAMMTNIAPIVCELHEQNAMNVYCSDCKTLVCALCFIDDHYNHKGSHVNKFVDDFRKQIESNVEAMNECRSKAENRKSDLLKVKEVIQGRVTTLECEIENRKEEVEQLIEKHTASLLQDLCSIRQGKQKEIQLETDDIDTYLSSLETYNSYCQNIMTKGSASDICCAFSDLSSRAAELQQQCQHMTEIEIQPFNCFFRKSELEHFQVDCYDNSIGEIQEEGESKPKKACQHIVLAEQRYETDLLSLRSANEQLRIEINTEVEANKTHKMTIKALEDNVQKLKQELLRTKQNQLRYISDPVLIQTIKTNAAKDDNKAILGLTILDNELFVVSEKSSEVEVYDSIELSFRRRWNLRQLMCPFDLASCTRNKCLYIIRVFGQLREILRVDPNGKLINKLSTGNSWGALSITDESNVILTSYNKGKLNEYSPEGQLIHEINLSSDASIRYPWHAIKLTNDHFVVSHGCFDAVGGGSDDRQRVCLVDADGKLKKSFGGERGSTIGQLNNPVHLSVDGNRFIIVADSWNSRVLLLDPDLKFKGEILSKEKHGLRRPSRILLDESNGRLLVVDNGWDSKKDIFVDGRILVFDF